MAFWQDKKVLITGHTGFKGSWLTIWLDMLGAKITGMALPPPTRPSLFELAGLERRAPTLVVDIRDPAAVRNAVRTAQPDVVFHMAAQSLVRRSYRDPVETYATNVMGTVHVLEAIRELDRPCVVVNVTSDKCYENREWVWPYREGEAMGGFDPYSSSKGCAELVTAAYRRSFYHQGGSSQGRKAVASVRAGNVIGGGDWAEDRLVPDCIRHFSAGTPVPIRNPASIRPWQHVLEPLHGYLLLAERLVAHPDEYAQGWNFGPPDLDAKPVRWIADRLARRWAGGASWVQTGDETLHEANTLRLDSSLASARLGWRTRLRLPEALDWVTDWYLRQRAGESAARLTEQQIESYLRREPSEP